MLRLIWIAVLIGLLTACGVSGVPLSIQLVEKAIALQLNLTQQQLHLQPEQFKIARLEITDVEPLEIQKLPAYHVWGTYNLTVKLLGHRVTQQQNPFSVYLQLQKEGKTWRLARPQSTSKDNNPTWLTYLIQ